MKSIFLGGASIALGLISASASAQAGGALGSSSTTVGTTSINVSAADAAATHQMTVEPGTDLKRATRKSRRDVSNGVEADAAVNIRATAQSSAERRTPGGGN